MHQGRLTKSRSCPDLRRESLMLDPSRDKPLGPMPKQSLGYGTMMQGGGGETKTDVDAGHLFEDDLVVRIESSGTSRSSSMITADELGAQGYSCWARFCQFLEDRGRRDLIHSLALNMLRDFFWALQSAEGWDSEFRPKSSASSQWGAQQLYSTLIPFLYVLGLSGFHLCRRNRCFFIGTRPTQETDSEGLQMFLAWLGASVSISTWNAGSSAGVAIARGFTRNPSSQLYFSSIFTGLFEGSTQWLVPTIGLSLANRVAKCFRRNRPCELEAALLPLEQQPAEVKTTLCDVGKQVLVAAGPGALPGTMWQIVFVACMMAGFSGTETAIMVCLCVALLNFFHAQFIAPYCLKKPEAPRNPSGE